MAHKPGGVWNKQKGRWGPAKGITTAHAVDGKLHGPVPESFRSFQVHVDISTDTDEYRGKARVKRFVVLADSAEAAEQYVRRRYVKPGKMVLGTIEGGNAGTTVSARGPGYMARW